MKVVGVAASTATAAGGLIALLSSVASAASFERQVRHHQTPLPVNNVGAPGKWKKAEIGWVKMNVDGSCEHHNGPSGCGGVLRDSSGKWILGLGFAMKLDPTNYETHETELQSILTGLELAREMNAEKLVLESDSDSVVSIVENGLGFEFQRSDFDVVQRIRKLLLDPMWQVKLVCVPRTANRVAIAKDARELSFYNALCKYYSAPGNCSSLLLDDNAYANAHGMWTY